MSKWMNVVVDCNRLCDKVTKYIVVVSNTKNDVMKFYLDPEDGGVSYHQIPISYEKAMVWIKYMKSALVWQDHYADCRQGWDKGYIYGR